LFARISETIFDNVVIADLTGTIREANETCCRTLGYGRKALLGMDLSSILSGGDAASILGLARTKRKRKKGLHLDLIAADGTVIPAECNAQYVTHEGKDAIFCVARDTREQARTEEDLKKGQEQCRAVLEEIEDGYWETDLAGRLTFVNDAMCAIAETTKEELLSGVKFSNYSDSGTMKQIYTIFEEVYRTGKPSDLGDHKINRRDGGTRVAQFNVSLIRDNRGKPVGFRGITRDVTERRAMEGALRESEEKLRLVTENMRDMVRLTDMEGKNLYVSPSHTTVLGYTPEERVGRSGFEVVHPEDLERVLQIFTEKIASLQAGRVEYRASHADGHYIWVETIGNLVHDAEGHPTGILMTTRDITERKAVEDALREREESYRNVLDLAPDAITIVRREDATYLQVNDAFCRQTGYSAEEIIGRTSADLNLYVNPADRRRLFGLLAREDRVDGIEIQYRAKDGTILDDLVSARPIRFRGEDCFLVMATVITSLKKAEQALRQSEEKYRTILEGIEAGYYELDLGGRFTFFNDALCRIMGYPREKLMGMEYREYTTPEAARRGSAAFSEVYRTGKPGTLSDHEIIRKDGKTVVLEQSILLMRNDTGDPIGFRGIAHDVSERRAMEKALSASEEKYRTILESMEDGYWEVDLSGRFTFFNDALCRMVELPGDELKGMESLDYANPEIVKGTYAIFREIYRTGKPANIVDYEFTKADGSRATHELSVSLMKDAEGTPVGFRGVSRDVTARKQAEEEIQTHREHLALINQILRHDLTNDLVVMQSSLNLYKISHEEELVEETEARVKKSLDLIDKMRALESFISSHKDLKAYKLRDIMDEIAGNYPFITIKVKGRGRVQVMADDSLFSVTDNIVRNAVIHGKADRIEVTIEKENDMCRVRIADNGVGIPDEIKETIFEEGFIHGDTGHTGLGLHIVRKAMEKYGGYVYVEDNKPKGTAFVLAFKAI